MIYEERQFPAARIAGSFEAQNMEPKLKASVRAVHTHKCCAIIPVSEISLKYQC